MYYDTKGYFESNVLYILSIMMKTFEFMNFEAGATASFKFMALINELQDQRERKNIVLELNFKSKINTY